MTPQRIQRKRTRGWKIPPNTISVTRPGKYGNIFEIGKQVPREFERMYCYPTFASCPDYLDNLDYLRYGIRGHEIEDAEAATRLFRQYMEWGRRHAPDVQKEFLAPLRGKNLACWCAIDKPCHGHVLIEYANANND